MIVELGRQFDADAWRLFASPLNLERGAQDSYGRHCFAMLKAVPELLKILLCAVQV
jgi:hypothetical protein